MKRTESLRKTRIHHYCGGKQGKICFYFEHRLLSPLTYRYLLNQPDACRDRSPLLVLLVPVAPQDSAARGAVRRTWGSAERDVLTLFFSGLPGAQLQPSLQGALQEESRLHADIIQMDFLDSYQNLTIKTMMMMKWFSTFCPHAAFGMKVDADVFVNVFLLLERLQRSPRRGFITGSVIYDGQPRRDPNSKWFLSEERYRDHTFPPYVSGAGYVFSGDMAGRISWASRFVRMIPLEDVYVGLCLRVLDVRPVYSRSGMFLRNLFEIRTLKYDRCTFARLLIVNRYRPAELLQIGTSTHDMPPLH
uniref:Hexosyltransferase n=1 Tax=Oryzias melastigma TaxID=30732 RepID=A0A3B3DAN5_ORYME